MTRARVASSGRLDHSEARPLHFPKFRRLSALLLLPTLLTLTPLAHASPPDPTWIPGIYDAADYDDVVAAVSMDSALVGTPPATLSFLTALGTLPPAGEAGRRTVGAPAFHVRDPPLLKLFRAA